MRRLLAHLGIVVLTALTVWNARCVTSCTADSLVPPCHKQKTHHSPQVASCTLQMVAERPGVTPDALPAPVQVPAVVWAAAVWHSPGEFVAPPGAGSQPPLLLRV